MLTKEWVAELLNGTEEDKEFLWAHILHGPGNEIIKRAMETIVAASPPDKWAESFVKIASCYMNIMILSGADHDTFMLLCDKLVLKR